MCDPRIASRVFLSLTVVAVNSVETLKAGAVGLSGRGANHKLCHTPLNELKAGAVGPDSGQHCYAPFGASTPVRQRHAAVNSTVAR